MSWWKKEKNPAALLPGECECGHNRCSHVDGVGACKAVEDEWPEGSACACMIYIRDDDDEDGNAEPEPDPSIGELERIYKQH